MALFFPFILIEYPVFALNFPLIPQTYSVNLLYYCSKTNIELYLLSQTNNYLTLTK